MSKYWDTSIRELLSDMGLDVTLTPAQITELVQGVEGIADMEYEASGRQYIPNPLQCEVDGLKTKLKKEREYHDKVTDNILGVVAHLGGVSRESVYFDSQDQQVKCGR